MHERRTSIAPLDTISIPSTGPHPNPLPQAGEGVLFGEVVSSIAGGCLMGPPRSSTIDTMDRSQTHNESTFVWPSADVSRVPYRVYTDPDIYAQEQARIFRGPTWNFLCLDAEIPNPGDYKTTLVGDAPVIVVRDEDGGINAMVNRCAHKGALVCYKPRGNTKELMCVYHNWTYDLHGALTGVAFRRGVAGQGGMPDDFDEADHGLERLRVDHYRGLVFGSFSDSVPPLLGYIGAEMQSCIDRVIVGPLKVLGYHSQYLPNNWKLYIENTRDSYHASLLHVFFNTFGVIRHTMGGGIRISDSGWHHHSYTERRQLADDQPKKLRALKEEYSLEDSSMLAHNLELGDQVTNSIQSIFPTCVVQQILNALAVRQLIPRGVERSELMWTILGFEDDDAPLTELRLKVNNLVGPAGLVSMEDGVVGGFIQQAAKADPDAQTFMQMGGRAVEPSEGSRVTEASVRGFWTGWRACMGV